jgi:ATP/maltotriose-dependent transcriptional regulator MalT
MKGEGTMRNWGSKAFVLLVCLALFAGCGTTSALQNARASLDKAKAAGAEVKDPANYYLGQAYYDKASHEAQEGDNDEAREFAAKSQKYSNEAIQKSGGGVK